MGDGVQVIYPRCAGLDVHPRTVVVCRVAPDAAGRARREVRTYRTMSGDLVALGDWLAAEGVTHVAMESTGVYWKPVFNLLEQRFRLLLVNAQHIKAVPGRKTDVRDCEWIADLLRLGLLRGSFVPDREQREARELTRYRTTLIRERAAEINRIQKTLEGANIKLGAVITNVAGVSGRAMLDAIVGGATQDDAAAVAQAARGTMRRKVADLEAALAGRVGAHQRFLLARQLAHLDELGAVLADVDREIAERLRPHDALLARLDGVPGIGRRGAEIVLAEIGACMDRFPSADHLAAWAGLAPATHQSAGKRRQAGARKGDPALRAVLVEAALAAARTKGCVFAARFRGLAARRGKKRAAVAIARHLLLVIYHMLKTGTDYEEHGEDYRSPHDADRLRHRLVTRLGHLGFTVTLTPIAATNANAAPDG